MKETEPTAFCPHPRRLECLTACRCNSKGSTFFSVILRPWVCVQTGSWTPTFRTEVRCSSTWANQAAVIMELFGLLLALEDTVYVTEDTVYVNNFITSGKKKTMKTIVWRILCLLHQVRAGIWLHILPTNRHLPLRSSTLRRMRQAATPLLPHWCWQGYV